MYDSDIINDDINVAPSKFFLSHPKGGTNTDELNTQKLGDYPRWEDMPEVTDNNNPNNGLNTDESDPSWEKDEE